MLNLTMFLQNLQQGECCVDGGKMRTCCESGRTSIGIKCGNTLMLGIRTGKAEPCSL